MRMTAQVETRLITGRGNIDIGNNDTTRTMLKQEKKNSMISPIIVLIGIMLGVATYLHLQKQSEGHNSRMTLLRLPRIVLLVLLG